jgi:S1-C subfamily serine protease
MYIIEATEHKRSFMGKKKKPVTHRIFILFAAIIISFGIVPGNYGTAFALRVPFWMEVELGENNNAVNETLAENITNAVWEQASPAVVGVYAYKDMPAFRTEYQRRGKRLTRKLIPAGTEKRQVSSGSAFFIKSDGYLLTNKHVVSDTEAEYQVMLDENNLVHAEVVYSDPDLDLAILKIAGQDYPTIPLGDSSNLSPGQGVIAIGNALGLVPDSMTSGSVTALNTNIQVEGDNGEESLSNLIESSAPLYPGDSGGPLLNSQGQAIAINVATSLGENLSYAIPIDEVKITIKKSQLFVSI